MITFKIATHVNNSVPVVELWEDNEMVGVIYPSDGRVRVISKFVSNVDIYEDSCPTIIEINLEGNPSHIRANVLVRN